MIDEFQRIVPALVRALVRFLHILDVDVDRTRPVLRRLRRFQVCFPPGFEFQFLDCAVEVLQFDCQIFLVDCDNLEQVAVNTTVPVANFRNRYPISVVPV